ncbi:esterase/lipase family protein [Colwelliaceae bacterium BS250]
MYKTLLNVIKPDTSPSYLQTVSEIPRAVIETVSLGLMSPYLLNLPKGDGHPVIVIPGFTATDSETYLLRQFLTSRNYKVHGLNMGRNVGPTAGIEKRLTERVKNLSQTYGEKVSIVGWSLGGLFARYVAHQVSEHIRMVISLGSPIGVNREFQGTSPIIELLGKAVISSSFVDLVDDESLHCWNRTPPVPTTAIYSKADGAVHWKIAIDPLEHEQTENIQVFGSHSGLTHNPQVFKLLANRLAQPEGQWQPFDYQGITKLVNNTFKPFENFL